MRATSTRSRPSQWASRASSAASASATGPAAWPAIVDADEIGAANYLTPAVALNAAKLVKTGKTYSLGITVNTTTATSMAVRNWPTSSVRRRWWLSESGSRSST